MKEIEIKVERWIAIVGSRDFCNYPYLRCAMDCILFDYAHIWGINLHQYEHDKIGVISGGARGADILGEKWAAEQGLMIWMIKPKWDVYGKRAGMIRNTKIVDEADLVVAFWDGESRGTADSIEKAQMKGKDLEVIFYASEMP